MQAAHAACGCVVATAKPLLPLVDRAVSVAQPVSAAGAEEGAAERVESNAESVPQDAKRTADTASEVTRCGGVFLIEYSQPNCSLQARSAVNRQGG